MLRMFGGMRRLGCKNVFWWKVVCSGEKWSLGLCGLVILL